tara:strand:- start:485716 stop:486201 length:486 start_codon:yes stop_codon:yes gene_type:complete
MKDVDIPKTITKPNAPTNSVCSICNYDLSGFVADESLHIICPECGSKLKAAPPEVLFTKSKLNKLYLKQLVIPSIIPGVLVLALLPIPTVGIIVFISYVFIAPLTQLILYLNVITTGIRKSKPHPRPYARRLIPLYAFIACLPFTILYVGLFLIARYLLNA